MEKKQQFAMLGLFLSMVLIDLASSNAIAAEVKEPYKIGMSAARTGPAAVSYTPGSEGIRVYIEKINEAGGINGRPIKLMIEDDGGVATKAGSNIKKFAEAGAHLVTVASVSATYGPAIAEAKRANIPILFGAGSVSPKESLPPNPDPLVFATSDKGMLADPHRGVETISQIASKSGIKQVILGIVVMDIPVAMGIAQGMKILAEKKGWDVIMSPIPPGAVDLTAVAAKWIEKGVNFGIESGPTVARLMYPALMKRGWKGNFVILYEAFNYLTDIKADNLYAICSVTPMEMMNLPEHKEIVKASKKYKASIVLTENLWGWDTGKVLEKILRQAGWPPTTKKFLEVMNDFECDNRPLARLHKWTPNDHLGSLVWRAYKWDKKIRQVVPVTDWRRSSATGEIIEKVVPKL